MVDHVNVSAIIVTRGDHDLGEILDSLPDEWERIIWDNRGGILIFENEGDWRGNGPPQPDNWSDLSVYGRYAAIEYASHELIYVQDDDCVVSDPNAIVERFCEDVLERAWYPEEMCVVCNMPSEFRHGFYEEHALVGFGAAFHRDAPARAFSTFFHGMGAKLSDYTETVRALAMARQFGFNGDPDFFHTCDVVFTALTPRVLVDISKTNLPWATDESRMYRQPGHQAQRGKMLELAFQAKEATNE